MCRDDGGLLLDGISLVVGHMRTYCAARWVLRELGMNDSLMISALAIDPAPELARGQIHSPVSVHPTNVSKGEQSRAGARGRVSLDALSGCPRSGRGFFLVRKVCAARASA